MKLITHGHRDSIDPAAIKQLRSVFLTRLEKQGFGPEQATQAADCVVATMTSRWDLVGKLRETEPMSVAARDKVKRLTIVPVPTSDNLLFVGYLIAVIGGERICADFILRTE